MKLFSEKVKPTSTNSSLNILQVTDYNEIFFGVYEVEINKNKYPVEKISEHKGNPVVSVPVEVEGIKANYPFVLTKGKPEIIFNENSDYVEIFESKEEPIESKEDIHEISYVEEIEEDIRINDNKDEILKEIAKAKKNALLAAKKEIERSKKLKLKELKEASDEKEQILNSYLETARENLVDEFTNISKRIKNELISENDDRFTEIKETIDNKIQDLADNLSESLKKDFNNSSKLIDKSIKQLVKELYEKNVNSRVDKELKEIAFEIVEKVSEIDKNLNLKIANKADISLFEDVNKEIDSIRDSNIELNNSLNKGVQKALSRVGNVDKKILEISEKFNNKISETEREVLEYFDEKLALIKEETLDTTDEARKYFQNLIRESRDNILLEIRKIKDEKPIEYILESKKGDPIVKDWDTIEKEWNKKIHDKFENYKTDLRKYVAVYASGGGTNATQYQDGGTMNGDLTIVGKLSANEYLGINIPSIEYLPLSGGTIAGDVVVTASLSASRIYTTQLDALSANLNGLNVQGNVVITNNIVSNGISNRLPNQLANDQFDILTRILSDSRHSNRNKRITDDTTFTQNIWEQFIDFDDQYNSDLLVANAFGSNSFGVSPSVFGETWTTSNVGVTSFQGNDQHTHRGIFLLRGALTSNQACYVGINRPTDSYVLSQLTNEFTCRIFLHSNDFTTQGYFKIGPIPKGGTGGGDSSLTGGLIFNPYLHPTNLVIGVIKTGMTNPFTFTTNPANVDFIDTGFNFINILDRWVNITYRIDYSIFGSPLLQITIVRENSTLFTETYNIASHPVISTWARRFNLYGSGASREIGLQYGKFTYTVRSQIFIDYIYYKTTGVSSAPSNWNSLRF